MDCDSSLSTFTRALVRPGYKLGVAATKMYRGVEQGKMHVNKVFHRCKDRLCTGETARGSRQDIVQLAITVSNVDAAAVGSRTDARATFVATFASAVAELLVVDAADIAIDTITALPNDSDTLRRWLQALVVGATQASVSFTINVETEDIAAVTTRIQQARNSTITASVNMNDGATAFVSTLTEPTFVPHDAPTSIQCREGHDPKSPLCHVCLDGVAQSALRNMLQFSPLPARAYSKLYWRVVRMDGSRGPDMHRMR
jgi:hypothetical protein